MKQAVIYVRVSDDRQVENTSLASQEAACLAWCARQGLTASRVFKDAGESAKTADRPQFQEAVKFCLKRLNGVGHFVVYKFNRFARNQADQVIFATKLRQIGVELHSATEQTDSSAFGMAMEGMLVSRI